MIKNATLSLIQTVFSIFALFFSYRFIVDQLGVEKLGLWALFLSIVSLARIAELGLSASVVKYISSSLAHNDKEKACSIIETVTLSVTVLVSLLSVLVYYPTLYLVIHILENEIIQDPSLLLVLAFVSNWLASMAAVNKGCLDGCQRYDLSTIAIIISTVVFITAIIKLVPLYGLNGLAYAYILQGLTLLILTRFMLKLAINILPVLPHKFSFDTFKELRAYGLKFQLMSFFTMLSDPLTKGMLGRFGDTRMIGYYELANKFITQMRSLLVAMNQVLIPKVSESKAKGLLDISDIYKKNYQLVSFTSVYFYTALLCMVPIIEIVWLNQRSSLFELFSIIAVGAYFINTLSIPAYMINSGTGDLRSNVISHAFMGIVNLVMGVLLGRIFGGKGVVYAWAIALIAGSLPIFFPFHKKNNIPLTILAPKIHMIGLILGLIGVSVCWFLHYYPLVGKVTFYLSDIIGTNIVLGKNEITFANTFFIILAFIVFPMWKNPTRKIITNLVSGVVKARKYKS